MVFPRSQDVSTEAGALNPTIFFSPGLKPDVRFTIDNQWEYHLHSAVLKLYSRFFQRFLDSPEKSHGPASAEFQYEYVSAKNEEIWILEPKGAFHSPPRTAGCPEKLEYIAGKKDLDRKAFAKLLLAIYNRTYNVDNPLELVTMTKIADFYCTLPILSATLTGALHGSTFFAEHEDHGFGVGFEGWSYTLLPVARQLRHLGLFRDCFIHAVGTWTDGVYFSLIGRCDSPPGIAQLQDDPELMKMISAAYIDLCKAVMTAQQELCIGDVRFPARSYFEISEYSATQQAASYRALYTHMNDRKRHYLSTRPVLFETVKKLVTNNLKLDEKRGSAHFTCTDLKDEDIPWDQDEIDF